MKNDLQLFYVGVKGVIVDPRKQKALVLVKTDHDGKKYYDIPGGRISGQETVEQTLKRELSEELPSLEKFEIGELLNAYRLSHNLTDGNGLLLLFYKVTAGIDQVAISEEHEDYLWVSKKDLGSLQKNKEIYIERGYFDALSDALL